MISSQSVEDFKAICGAVAARAVTRTQELCLAALSEAQKHGMRASSRTVLEIDKVAADTFSVFAEEVYSALKQMNAAEPTADPSARRTQLLDLLEHEMRDLATAVYGARGQFRSAASNGLQNSNLIDEAPALAVIERAVAEYRGRLGLDVTARGNTAAPASAVVHQPVFHAPVGNYQAGDRNTATVTQSVVTEVTPTDVKAALDALIQALQEAHSVPTEDREAVGRMLKQLKDEADSEKPNRRTVGTLVAGSRDVAELLVAAPGAWETVKNWASVIATSAAQAAPVIGQALHNLGS